MGFSSEKVVGLKKGEFMSPNIFNSCIWLQAIISINIIIIEGNRHNKTKRLLSAC